MNDNVPVPTALEVRADTVPQAEERLDAAVLSLQSLATHGYGILVTRLGPGHFSVALSGEVPFGQTRELSR